ncbi:MAG: leucine-rich repeat domain-containing protein [Candidatus Coprovivens sp.]
MNRFINSVKGRVLMAVLVFMVICIPAIFTSYSVPDYFAGETTNKPTFDTVSMGLKDNVQVLFEELLVTNYGIINSNTYLVTDKYIERIEPNTDISEFSKKFNRIDFIITLDGEVINKGIVKTGMVLTINNVSYTLVVKGDVSKDGLLNYVDTSMIINNSKTKELDELSLLASDINDDGIVNRDDVLCSIEYIFNGTLDIKEINKVTAPTLEIVEGTKGSGNWYQGNVTVKFNSNGVEYGAYRIVGSKDETIYNVEDGTLINLRGGAYKIIAWNYAEDGNRSNSVSIVLKIDEVNQFRCTIEEDRLYLREYLGTVDENTDFVVPATYYGYPVYGIGSDEEVVMEATAFKTSTKDITTIVHKNIFGDDLFDADLDEFTNLTIINSLTIEDGIKEIGKSSFAALKEKSGDLYIPDSVEYIGDLAFASNFNQAEGSNVYIGKNVRYIGMSAFGLTRSSNGLVIPENVEYLGEESLASMDIKGDVVFKTNKLTSIPSYAFSGSVIDGDVNIPDNVELIEEYAFQNVVINGDLNLGGVVSIADNAFWGAVVHGNINLGNKLTTIGYRAFYDAKLGTGDLVIPDSVTSIEPYAFSAFEAPNSKLVLGSGITAIENNTFEYSKFAGDLTIPNSVQTIGNRAFASGGFTGNLVIPDSVISIDTYAFSSNAFNGYLQLGVNVKSIGAYAFAYNPNLTGSIYFEEYGCDPTAIVETNISSVGPLG